MSTSKLLILGDSVHWGQGLLPAHKPGAIVARARRLEEAMVAHSGATIGASLPLNGGPVAGEVPVAAPTILDQADTTLVHTSDVAAILVNGGINDVDIRVILSPLTSAALLRAAIRRYCLVDMTALLTKIATRFPDPSVPVVLTGYYPILSEDSHPMRIPFLMQSYGIGVPFFVDHSPVFLKTVELCTLFATESTAMLQQAVATVNAALGQSRIRWADPGFGASNAVFASDPWLFGVNGDFSPQDEVVDGRRHACDLHIPPLDVFGREGCYRASAGHPNRAGAQKYADAVLAVL